MQDSQDSGVNAARRRTGLRCPSWPATNWSLSMKNTLSRIVAPALAVLAISAAGVAFAQSGTAPSGTPAAKQPGSSTRPSSQARAAEAPKIIAVNFYADWCPGCKALKPKLEEAMMDASGQPCLTVKLDQTDKNSKQSEYMLSALGLGDLWKEHAGKTGYVLLVDAKTHKVVNTITYKQEVKEINAALAAALRS